MTQLVVMLLFSFIMKYFVSFISVGQVLLYGKTELDIIVNLDIIYAPVFVFALACILKKYNLTRVFLGIELIGKHSLTMWFLSCLFFSSITKYVYQPILYIFKQPILVVLWGTLLCLLFAIGIDWLVNIINNKKNKLLK
jgi:hypothetical protein